MTTTDQEFSEKLSRLRSLLFQFDSKNNELKAGMLKELILLVPKKHGSFMQFHQVLMCMMAYPSDKSLLELVEKTTSRLLTILNQNSSLREKLSGTGLLHTAIECNFTFNKVNYLILRFPNQVSIHSAASSLDTQKSVLKLILPNTEYSRIHAGEKDFKSRISQFHFSTKQTDLEWLMQTILQSGLDQKIQSLLYNQLGIYIQWSVSNETDSLSFLRGTSLPVYYHTTPLEKKTDFQSIVSGKLPAALKLNLNERRQFIHSAKMSLVYLYRETEPFTNANEEDITVFQLDKGISVALFGSTVDKRYSLESYIGYLVLKNNIPVSYGGGWIFGERCQFGINILESFRGGESALIICELLRVYHQHFGATRFVVKPYQFGLHNPEAIKTGAFWFYYKLGFRPENKTLKELALQEENQKLMDPKYKSEAATLKKYTKSNIALTLTESSYPDYDSELLSQRITAYINEHFNGDRQKALSVCFNELKKNTGIETEKWKPEDIDYAKHVSVLFYIKPGSCEWQKKHQKNIQQFILLKSEKTEISWIKHLQRFDAFWEYIK
ncbi:MAG: hypothetical protein K0S53_763 [Bacteroidetes bacterium]|jgi:hypothetical protein|nr:hypothetical protein [Bacteroidota bacterium]MDF2451519.1 hypothetical protein [Bacteroidota bacterium]